MKIKKLSKMTGGWFIGDFHPSLFRTKRFEVAVQRFFAGEITDRHFHKIAKEYTVIVSGKAKVNKRILSDGDIVILEPGEKTEFRALTEVITAVVKIPSVKSDKYNVG